MYKQAKYKNTQLCHYYSLSKQFQPQSYYPIRQTQGLTKPSYVPIYQNSYTFSRDFYPNVNKNSAYEQKRYIPKYRSTSLPSECIVRNMSSNHFSYYDQLKRRDYIAMRNCHSIQNKSFINREKYLSFRNLPSNSSSFNNLNRFSKYDPGKKLVKNQNGPILRTNVKVYDKPDQNNHFTTINTNFQPMKNFSANTLETNNIQRRNEIPMIDCSIEIKSDDDGRFYSTVQSQFPAILTNQKSFYDQQKQIFTTQATLIRNYSQSFDNLYIPEKKYYSNHIQNPSSSIQINQIKPNQNQQKQIPIKLYDTYVVKKKQNSIKREKKSNSNKSHSSKRQKSNQPKLKNIKSPIKKQVFNQYLSDSKSSQIPSSNRKKKSQIKNTPQNLGLQYFYSKYYITETQSKKQNKSKSINKQVNSDRNSKAKDSLTKTDQNKKTAKKLKNAQSPKTNKNDKQKRNSTANYASTHLLTTKR